MDKINSLKTWRNSLLNAIKKIYKDCDQPIHFSFAFKNKILWEWNAVITFQYFSSIKQYQVMWLNLRNYKTNKNIPVPWNFTIELIKAQSTKQEDFYEKVKNVINEIWLK